MKKSKHVFILIYMVGCGPCNATKPEWEKMCKSLNNKYSSNDQVAILDLDSQFVNEVEGLGSIEGFPTMKYINKNDGIIEAYEDSNIRNKDRISTSFIDWIESKVSEKSSPQAKPKITVNELSEIISSKQPNSAKTIRPNSVKSFKNHGKNKKQTFRSKKNKFGSKNKKKSKRLVKKNKIKSRSKSKAK